MSRTTINGVEINVPSGASICIINNKVYINGEEYKGEDLKEKEIVNVIINGEVGDISCSNSVEVHGNVLGDIEAGNSVRVEGDAKGNIDCGNSVRIEGSHTGTIDAGGSVKIGK